MKNINIIKTSIVVILLSFVHLSSSQNTEDAKQARNFSGVISVTSKGISTIPSFTLGKPAVEFNLSMGGEKLRFEPLLRFELNGKPWSLIFWWRYNLLESERFQLKLGAHPAFMFKTLTVETNGNLQEIIRSDRYLAGDLAPNFSLSKNISIGPYYLYSRGLEKDIVKNTHFISMRTSFSNINLSNNLSAAVTPQLYYLKMDKLDGFYFTSYFGLSKKNFPLSISAVINKKIQSEVAGDDFLWNVSLVYSFRTKYLKL